MLAVPPELARRYEARLVRQNIMAGQRMHDHQWLRYYLDFCGEYSFAPMDRQSLPAFQAKLRAKHQPEALCQQAGHAVSLVLGDGPSIRRRAASSKGSRHATGRRDSKYCS